MQAKELDKLNGSEASLLLAKRLRNFARGGLAPELVLRFAVHPEIDVPVEAPESAPETATAA
jgi:hypothetical protein